MSVWRTIGAWVLVFSFAGAIPAEGATPDPDFFWLPPTVPASPASTGPFDATALDALAVEVCELDASATCVAGPPIARFTSTGTPMPGQIELNEAHEFYTVQWLTGRGHVDRDLFYRVRVLKSGVELGTIDVDFVQNTPELASVDATRYIGLVRGQQLTIRFRVQHPTARTRVRVNEIESNGGVPGDWIELYNAAAVPVGLADYVIKDNDDTHVYRFPAGTTIPPQGYYVIEEEALDFGLGANDAVRLFTPDGLTLVDSHSWTGHAVTTYGRCPDGTGAFRPNTTVTKGAANDCSIVIRINEVESSGGTPGDWVELYNPGPGPADLAGFSFKDNDDTHNFALPAVVVAAGGYLLLEEADLGFGLGSADAARLFRPDGSLADAFAWTSHAATTYGRCPNGSGAFATTAGPTKGAANSCVVAVTTVHINEVESSGGVPGDWIELVNTGAAAADVSGWLVRDNDDTHNYVLPPGSVVAPGGYLMVEEAALGFGLGAADSARLFDSSGTLFESFTWTAHAATTYGRCPDGTGAFATTTSATKGAANACPGAAAPWPGDSVIQTADGLNVLGGNMSGLVYEGSGSPTPGVLWAAKNGPGTLFRLIWDQVSAIWTPDPANSWGTGKTLRYPDGTGNPDAEGVTFAGSGSGGGIYISTERNNDANGVSRNTILRFDPSAAGSTLIATHEWNLTADLPVVGPNLGTEAITWIPDAFLVSRSFVDESKGPTSAYNPADYPNHGDGLFFVGLEANGTIYAYALDHVGGGVTRVATITSGFAGVMDLHFDRELSSLWAICDDTCQGRSAVLQIGVGTGTFAVTHLFDRPGGMPNLNNEGFAFTPLIECVGDRRPSFWSDDSATGGHAIRSGTLTCAPF